MRTCRFSAQQWFTDSLIRDSNRQRGVVDLARAAASVRGVRGSRRPPIFDLSRCWVRNIASLRLLQESSARTARSRAPALHCVKIGLGRQFIFAGPEQLEDRIWNAGTMCVPGKEKAGTWAIADTLSLESPGRTLVRMCATKLLDRRVGKAIT